MKVLQILKVLKVPKYQIFSAKKQASPFLFLRNLFPIAIQMRMRCISFGGIAVQRTRGKSKEITEHEARSQDPQIS